MNDDPREVMCGRCEACNHAVGEGRYRTPTFEKDGYAICDEVVFNDGPFWDEDYTVKSAKPVPAAWVVDASDYWAALHVTPEFGCNRWEARDD